MRLIDANALAKHIKDLPTWWADDGGVYPGGSMKYPDGMFYPEDIISSIDNAPTVDAVEVVHGRWIKTEVGNNCSACGLNVMSWSGNYDGYEREKGICLMRYCPHCGAKMDLED